METVNVSETIKFIKPEDLSKLESDIKNSYIPMELAMRVLQVIDSYKDVTTKMSAKMLLDILNERPTEIREKMSIDEFLNSSYKYAIECCSEREAELLVTSLQVHATSAFEKNNGYAPLTGYYTNDGLYVSNYDIIKNDGYKVLSFSDIIL